MFRRLMLAALALCAFLSLESCGVSRIAGPVDTNSSAPVVNRHDPVGDRGAGGVRTDDGSGEPGVTNTHPTIGRTGGPDRSN